MPTPVENALQILIKAKTEALSELSAVPDLQYISIRIEAGLTSLINNLNFHAGHSYTTIHQYSQKFEPVTEFMGEKLVFTNEVTLSDTTPTLNEKEIFLAKVDALQATIRDREPETLIKDFSGRGDDIILRKVAKNAGLQDYEDGIVNIDFVLRIKAGLDDNDQRAKEQDLIEQQLSSNPLDPKVGEGGVSEVMVLNPDDVTTTQN